MKSFQSETKTFFLLSKMHSFRHGKESSKNVANTTSKKRKKLFYPLKPNQGSATSFPQNGH